VQSDVADDIGVTLTDDKPLVHEFRLRNPTKNPIRILNARALKTCCSSVGPIPHEIPSGGEATVPVVWKPGHQSGRKRVQFVINTDRADSRTIDLSLTANLLPAWEVSPSDVKSEEKSPVQNYQVTPRMLGQEGRTSPTALEISGPYLARFAGDPTQTAGPGDVIESRRLVEIELTTQGVGTHSGELRLIWADGSTKTYPISRKVLPHLRSTPSTLVVGSKDSVNRSKVIVQSDGQPFRILAVNGAAIVKPIDPEAAPAATHILDLDLSQLDRSKPSEIELSTDHPMQKSVIIRVFVVASEKEPVP
jgi:hypothetical protein